MEGSDRTVAHLASGEGESVWLLGDLYTFKAVSEDTGGAFALWETTSPPQGGPPPHLHHREDETFYVLEGEMEFWAGGETIRAGAGYFVYIPRGTMHTFKNVGTTPATFLGTVVPGGFEKFFLESANRPRTAPLLPKARPTSRGSSPPLRSTTARYHRHREGSARTSTP